ncbi:MAG: NADH-quinone oxidoreductase subunit H [Polyangiaceae bacterium]
MAASLLSILVFPGFLFLLGFALLSEQLDRFLYARMQNRMGPPWFQPLADVIKLAAKEDTIPDGADRTVFRMMPVFALTSVVTAVFYVPIWSKNALSSFVGDLVVVLYLLTIPTLTFFLGGWFSRSPYSLIGAARAITQLFAYEIPLLLAILSPAMLAGSWSLSEIARFYSGRLHLIPVNVVGFGVALVALLGKLERVPFDSPEAETEIVAGSLTEYGGRYLALFRLCVDVEMVVGAALLAAVFLPFGLELHPALTFCLFTIKVEGIIFLLSLTRAVVARLRIDQTIDFCWKYLAPIALLQLVLNLVLKGYVK